MKKFLLAGAAFVVLMGAAQAADLPSTEEPVFTPAPTVAPAFSWTGFYAGVNLGYGWGEFTADAGPITDTAHGFLGGAQIGYNYQFGGVVAGIEADWQLSNMSSPVTGGGDVFINNFGTARVRLGFAADRFLPYLTGGYAFANTELDVPGNNDTAFHNGWVIGAGVEYAWSDNITTKLEGLYMDFEEASFNGGVDAGASVALVRAGLNFKF
jgi:outer membrane immunogenic protein